MIPLKPWRLRIHNRISEIDEPDDDGAIMVEDEHFENTDVKCGHDEDIGIHETQEAQDLVQIQVAKYDSSKILIFQAIIYWQRDGGCQDS